MVNWTGLFQSASASSGVSASYFDRLAKIESNYNVNAKNALGSGASGPWQFIPSTAKAYGLSNPFDPIASTNAVAKFTADNKSYLENKLGRPASSGELYLAHQQGAAGAVKLLSNPNALAFEIVGAKAVTMNGGNLSMTASQFAGIWTSKFNDVALGGSGPNAAEPFSSPTNSGPMGTEGTEGMLQNVGWFGDMSGAAPQGTQYSYDGTPKMPDASNMGGASPDQIEEGKRQDRMFAWLGDALIRGSVIITGFIFIGVGLWMFKPGMTVNVIQSLATPKV